MGRMMKDGTHYDCDSRLAPKYAIWICAEKTVLARTKTDTGR